MILREACSLTNLWSNRAFVQLGFPPFEMLIQDVCDGLFDIYRWEDCYP